MSRTGFFCPECKCQSVGTLLDDEKSPIRCEHNLLGWESVQIGTDKKTGQPIYEHTPQTKQGCGGISRLCVHGLRVCESCPPQFTKATEPLPEYVRLSAIVEREKADAERRRDAMRHAEQESRRQPMGASNAPTFATPRGKVQLPFLGEAEPTTYKPHRGRKKT